MQHRSTNHGCGRGAIGVAMLFSDILLPLISFGLLWLKRKASAQSA